MEPLKEKFIRAITFCLRRDGQDGDFKALAEWALSPGEERPPTGDVSFEVALVAGGATKIKEYVFESARLPEIRGASGLLDRINLVDVPSLFGIPDDWGEIRRRQGENIRREFRNRSGFDAPDCPDCVIYASGGEILAFARPAEAPALADAIEYLYARETMVAQSVAVWQKFTLRQLRDGLLAGVEFDDAAKSLVRRLLGHNPADNRTFGSLTSSLALAKFRRREVNDEGGRAARAVAHVETVPFARRCSSCERRGAVVVARLPDEERPLCEPCARKRVYGQMAKKEGDGRVWKWYEDAGLFWEPRPQPSWVRQFVDWLKKHPEENPRNYPTEGARIADDLSEIGQAADPRGFIGVVYADGNNMGALLERLPTPAAYKEFSSAIYEELINAVFASLARCLPPLREEVTDGRGELKRVYPFEILSIGGDDVFLIVPAHVALPLAHALAAGVEERLLRHRSAPDLFERRGGYTWEQVQRCKQAGGRDSGKELQCAVSLSAGVVIADAHTPVFYLRNLAEQLLKSAKERAKQLRKRRYYGGTIDFLALKSVTMLSGSVEQFRRATQQRGAPRGDEEDGHGERSRGAARREGKRFYARPYTLAETEALLKSVRRLKQSDFPRSQLYRLRESLRAGEGRERGTVDYLYFLTRNADAARREIEDLWTPVAGSPPPHPWLRRIAKSSRPGEPEWETVWGDIIELYDFVEEEDGDAVGED